MASLLLWLLYLGCGAAVLALVRWLRPRRCPSASEAAFVLVLPVLFCLPGFFRGRTLVPIDHVRLFAPWSIVASPSTRNANLNDVATQIAPWAKAVRMAWKEGSLPWRNRWNGGGMALAANGQSGAFSPFTFLMLPLPLAHAFTLAVSVKLLLALLGVWLWLVEMELSRPAALLGAVSFAFSMTMTPWLLFALSGVFCLWPWALFAIERMRADRVSGRPWLLLALVFAGWILAGHPESAVLGACFVGLFVALRLLFRDASLDRRAVGMIAVAGVLAAGIAAFLWLPELLAIRASNRYVLAQAIRESLPVTLAPHAPAWRYGFLTSLFPRVLGDDFTSPKLAGAAASFPEMALGYFGIVAWALALQIWRPDGRRDRRELALLGVLVCGLAIGTGTWPVFDLFLSLPFVKLVLPLRSLSWVSLAGAAIAAFEVDRLRRRAEEGRRSLLLDLVPTLLLAGILTLAFAHFRAAHAASGGLAGEKEALLVSLLALAASGSVLLIWRGHAGRPTMTLLLVAVGTAELFLQGTRLYRWGSPADVFPPTPLVKFLRSQEPPFRIVGEDAALFPNTNVFAGVESIQTHDAVERRDYVKFLDETCGYDPTPYFKHVRDLDAPVLDFLNVRFLVTANVGRAEDDRWKLVYSGPDGRVFENRRVLPRVFAPGQIRFEGGPPPSNSLAGMDWSRLAIVRGHPDVSGGRVVLAQNLPVEVTGYRESTNRVSFKAFSAGPVEHPILVTSLVDDGGWTASDEKGTRMTTVRANGVFLGLVVEPGPHEIRLDYRPPGLDLGVLTSLGSIAVLVVWLVFGATPSRTREAR